MPTLQDGRTSVNVSANKTIVDNESGLVQNVIADAKILTLPAAAPGKVIAVKIGGVPAGGPVGSGANKTVGLTIARAGTDTFAGLGATGTAVTMAKAAGKGTDEIRFVGGTGVWYVEYARGSWVIA